MTMYKALKPKNDIDWFYVSRKGGRGIASIEDKDTNPSRALVTVAKNLEKGFSELRITGKSETI